MDFFSRQEHARRRTSLLVFMFFLALVGIIATAYVAITMIVQVALADPEATAMRAAPTTTLWNLDMLLGVGAAISIIVLGGTAFKLSQLKQGGGKVAEMLGGNRLDPASTQFHERRLLNVVEEMALASGIPVPPVYVMRGEGGINAFAAGYSVNDAVVGITEGAMRGLTREELQGVIAHEFSHILNGDMRLNIRLIGVLHGLLILAILGRVMLRLAGSSRSGSNKKGGGVALFLALGLALMIIGYFGYFFGGLIKRAVSRQREYLADASAVQFTRNPEGLAGALKKIGGLSQGGSIQSNHAEELSHMFFADGIKRFMGAGSLFATHPPLKTRVKLLDPNFNGEFPLVTMDDLANPPAESVKDDASSSRTRAEKGSTFIKKSMMLGGAFSMNIETMIQQIGVVEAAGLDATREMMDELPEVLRGQVHDPLGAQSVILALLLRKANQQENSDAWVWIPTAMMDPVGRCMDMVDSVKPEHRLFLVEMAIPALRSMSREQAEKFVKVMQQVIAADLRVVFFEFAVSEIVQAGLREILGVAAPKIQYTSIDALWNESRVLLSMLAHAGQTDSTQASAAFAAGAARLGPTPKNFVISPLDKMSIDDLGDALHRLLQATMVVRKQLLEAALTCLMHDETVTIEELELFRAFASTLEIPVPPGLFTLAPS